MNKLKIKDVLTGNSQFAGWLYVKDNPVNLDSECLFYRADFNLSPEEEANVRLDLTQNGWRVTLSAEDVEDILDNVCEQIESPTTLDLLKAFKFFIENDAFLEFD